VTAVDGRLFGRNRFSSRLFLIVFLAKILALSGVGKFSFPAASKRKSRLPVTGGQSL
jgi:hypothetical protein